MALEMSLLRMIALQPLLPTSDPAQARPVREAAPASDSLTASLDDLAASLQATAPAPPAAENTQPAEPPATPAPAAEPQPAAPAAASEHEPPPWEEPPTTATNSHDENDDVPPWVSETIPDDSERTPAKKPEPAPAAAIAPETAAPPAVKKPAAPPANTTDPGDLIDNLERWSDFLPNLDLHEYPLLLLENSVPASWQAPLLSLYTAPTGIIFDQAQNREQAAAAIAHALGIACTIEIQPADALKTPIEYRRQKNAAAQQRAEQDFLNHPQIRTAQATFGPALQVDNIQPLNPQE